MYQLKTRTSYSLLKSLVRIPEYIKRAQENGVNKLGIMDENVLYGAIEFYQTAKKAGIQAIIGMSLSYTADDEKEYWLDLIAKDLIGYRQLMKLSSKKQIEKNIGLSDILPDLSNILVIFSDTSEFVKYARDNFTQCQRWVEQFKEFDCYFGIESTIDSFLTDTATQLGLPLFALKEVRYFDAQDELAYQAACAIIEQRVLHLEEIERTGTLYYLSSERMIQRFAERGFFQAVENAQIAIDKINFDLPLNQTLLPQYPLEEEENAADYLRRLTFEKLPERVENPSEEYTKRLEEELSVIHDMGFNDYFLIVWDLLDFAHRQNIFTGAGRGSAAGSLVSFVLNITGVDPIKYDLLFERFLNKERYTMPDIDIDIPDNKRQDLLQYVAKKYGKEHVAQISTFGTLAAKQVLTDVGRVFGLKVHEARELSAAVPFRLKMTLDKALQESPALRSLMNKSERNLLLFEIAKALEGLPRNVSTHAAGVVICDRNLFDLIPLQEGSNDIYLTQFTMYDVEKVGLLKMDFLGLRNLKIIAQALEAIEYTYHEKLDIHQISLEDEETLELFQKGTTSGIFQFESSGIRNVLRKVHPTSIEDVVAVNALYRPGPMENIDHFANRKNGKEKIMYPEESLRPILENTYGIMVYQEQVMQVLQKMAGFTLGQADIVRRAIGKKTRDVMDKERHIFINGAKKQGIDEASAKSVYDYIEKFANYGFNRSHAFAYSFVGYQMAYLKVHYPGAFYQSLLRANHSSMKKVREYVAEAKRAGIEIKTPDINLSYYSFQLVTPQQIRFGFSEIRGLRNDFIQDLLAERKQNGRFQSFAEFLSRLDVKWLKEEFISALIYTGAFDNLEKNRQKLINELPRRIENLRISKGLYDIFEGYDVKESMVSEFPIDILLEKEKEYLGTFLSTHPLEQYKVIKKKLPITDIIDANARDSVLLLVQLKRAKIIRTKKNEAMAFISVLDTTGEMDVTIFPRLYRNVQNLLNEDEILLVQGKVEMSKFNEELQLLAASIEKADEVKEKFNKEVLLIRIEEEQESTIKEVEQLLLRYKGEHSVLLVVGQERKRVQLESQFNVLKSEVLLDELIALLGQKNALFYKRK